MDGWENYASGDGMGVSRNNHLGVLVRTVLEAPCFIWIFFCSYVKLNSKFI
jgi:hypothetical protein